MRLFLIGMLCGVMVATAFTYVFAIPANNYYWQTEIWEHGGAAWTFDMKSGRAGWKWLVEPKAATLPQKRVSAPASETNARTEQL
jgi:acyl-coenzyme A synthetase/AMP-(fatty) acid ligase